MGGEAVIARRRRAARREPGADVSLNLTSMIDVVFLLLVYFMVATEFRRGEEVYRLDLPDRGGAAAIDPFDLDDEPLRVAVRGTGTSDSLEGDRLRIRIDVADRTASSLVELERVLESLHVASGQGIFAADHPVIVEPTPGTRWRHAMGAFNAAVRAGYGNVTLGEPR